jgi:hypothetical protein
MAHDQISNSFTAAAMFIGIAVGIGVDAAVASLLSTPLFESPFSPMMTGGFVAGVSVTMALLALYDHEQQRYDHPTDY